MTDDLEAVLSEAKAALHAAIDDCDEVGWDEARTSDLRPEAVHEAIDAVLCALAEKLRNAKDA